MSALRGRFKRVPFHPFLLAVYPVLALLAANLAQVRPAATARALLICLAAGGGIYLLAYLLTRSAGRAAPAASLLLVLFFSYGHVYQLVEGKALWGLRLGRHAVLAPLWLGLLALGLWVLLRKSRRWDGFNRVLNAAAGVLVLLVVGQFAFFAVRVWRLNSAAASVQPQAGAALTAGQAALPDIYYIVLDGYTRQDALQEHYGYDNSGFIAELESLGFVIPDCTQSNYAYTVLSLASTFHMDYVEKITTLIQQGDTDRDWLAYQELIRDTPVRQQLAGLGYKMAAFETGYWWGEITDADYYIVPNDNPLQRYAPANEINNFEVLLVRTTALRVLMEAGTSIKSLLPQDVRLPEQRHYDQVNFALDQLGQVPALPGPKFVFAHIVAPHPPFVFSETGEYRNLDWKAEGYAPEVAYLNGRVIAAVKQILAQSQPAPVIVIQGDHGWDADNRMKILNAYYLPGGAADRLTPQITPVNTFRLIFDAYFGGTYGFVPDVSYYSTEEAIYQFEVRPPTCVPAR